MCQNGCVLLLCTTASFCLYGFVLESQPQCPIGFSLAGGDAQVYAEAFMALAS